MKEKLVCYLAGPIDGVAGEESSGWRNKVMEAIPDIEFLDPLRRKWSGFDYDKGHWLNESGPTDTDVIEIVESDKQDILNSDVVFVYHDRPSVGTSMEVLYAFDRDIYVVTVGATGRALSPWILYHSTTVVDSLEEGIEKLKDLLNQYQNIQDEGILEDDL